MRHSSFGECLIWDYLLFFVEVDVFFCFFLCILVYAELALHVLLSSAPHNAENRADKLIKNFASEQCNQGRGNNKNSTCANCEQYYNVFIGERKRGVAEGNLSSGPKKRNVKQAASMTAAEHKRRL